MSLQCVVLFAVTRHSYKICSGVDSGDGCGKGRATGGHENECDSVFMKPVLRIIHNKCQ